MIRVIPMIQPLMIPMTARNPFDIIDGQRDDDVKDFEASVTDIKARAANGNTLLIHAVERHCWKIAKFLLEAKADASGTGSTGWTALHYVANYGPFELIKPAIEAKCGIDIQSELGSTALMFAAPWGPEAVRVLLEAKANTTLKTNGGLTALDQTTAGSESQNLLLQAGLSAPPEAPLAPLPANIAFVA